MGIEDSIKGIQQLQSSIQNLSIVLLNIEEKLENAIENAKNELKTSIQPLHSSTIDSPSLSSIESLPQQVINIEESLGSIQKSLEASTKETKDDLKFIKVSYVEDVVGNMRNLSKEISDMVRSSSEKTQALYEASVSSFEIIDEKLNNIENNLRSLIENQTDQLATVADLRDRVNAIIQVELASLRDRIAIYLEANVNELKTSVTERLAIQEGTLQKLSQLTQQLAQNISVLPEATKKEIDTAVETKIIAELASMKKEMKKMTAFIIRTRKGESRKD